MYIHRTTTANCSLKILLQIVGGWTHKILKIGRLGTAVGAISVTKEVTLENGLPIDKHINLEKLICLNPKT